MKKTAKRKARGDGCGYLVATGVVSSFFLVVNGILVASLYLSLTADGPRFLQHPRAASVIAIAGPALLVFIEWRCIDWLVDLLTPNDGDGSRSLAQSRTSGESRRRAKSRSLLGRAWRKWRNRRANANHIGLEMGIEREQPEQSLPP